MLLVDMDPTAAAVEFISPAWSAAVAHALRPAERGVGQRLKNRAAEAAKPICVVSLVQIHFCIAATAALFFIYAP